VILRGGRALLHALWPARRSIVPAGSRRQRCIRACVHVASRWRREGTVALGAAAWARLRALSREQPGVPVDLATVVDRARQARGVVIFLPSIGWQVALFQRPHHLARTLARRGFVVVFDCSNASDPVRGLREIEPNLFLFRGAPGTLRSLPDPWLWTLPYNVHLATGFPGARVVYDWLDELSVFAERDPVLVSRNHARALREADLVLSVARVLHDEARSRRPDAVYLPNAVDAARFMAPAAPPSDPRFARFVAGASGVAGYYGAIARWLDFGLLRAAARRRPWWRFVLIGPAYDEEGRRALASLSEPNVLWLGPRPYESLPGYLSAFDVALIPFLVDEITRATSPLKLYEYLAAGKPVVTTPMPECLAHPEVFIATDGASLAAALPTARAQACDPAFIERMRRVAESNSWEKRVDVLVPLLTRRASPAEAAIDGPDAA
jgi:glycosyltransferase involved in cell wall biosynthesis